MSEFVVRVAERIEGAFHVRTTHPIRAGETLLVGREAAAPIAADPIDPSVSRVAAEIRRESGAWIVQVRNRNGAVIHPWAQAPYPVPTTGDQVERLPYARVAVRILGSDEWRHWILMESQLSSPAAPAEPGADEPILTELGRPPPPLTAKQHEVLEAMFGPLLTWPPTVPAEPLQIKQVARSLGISESAVQERLKEIRAKSESLGLARRVTLTDPEYLYVLVRAGYLDEHRPPASPDR